MKVSAPAIITSREVIIAGYDAVLDQSDQQNLYNHLSNYTNLLLRLLLPATTAQYGSAACAMIPKQQNTIQGTMSDSTSRLSQAATSGKFT